MPTAEFFNKNVQKHFLLIFIPLFILAGVAAFAFYSLENKSARKLLAVQEMHMVDLRRQAVKNTYRHIISDLKYITQSHSKYFVDGPYSDELVHLIEAYLAFSKDLGIYDQIRFLDIDGNETFRINYKDGKPVRIPLSQMQNKSERYYFREGMKLNRGEVYVSPIDLNIEYGEIEKPFKPTVRFVAPVVDANGLKHGIVVINYNGNDALHAFKDQGSIHWKHLNLLNADGYWLHSPDAEREWGFMIAERKRSNYSEIFPQEWKKISGAERGQFETANGLFSHTRLYPLDKLSAANAFSSKAVYADSGIYTSTGNYWIVLSNVSIEELLTASRLLAYSYGLRFGLACLVIFLISLIMANAFSRRRQAEVALRRSEALKAVSQDAALDCIITINHEGNILEFNPAAEQTFGYSKSEVVGKSLANTIIPDDLRDKHTAGMARLLQTKEVSILGKIIEIRGKRADGSIFPLELSVSQSPYDDPPVFIGFIRDITERKKAEGRIRTLSSSVEQANESVVITDRDGIIEYVNPAFCRITGYSEEDAIGQNPRILNSGKQDRHYFEQMWATILAGKGWQSKIIDRKKDGSFYPALLTISPIVEDTGEISHFVGVQQDLTAYDELEAKFHQAQKMEAVGTLVGGIAHDFNNMLAGITGNLFLVKREMNDRPELLERLSKVDTLCFKAGHMISQLLAFARKGKVELQLLSFSPFVKEAVKLARVSIPENIRVTQDICYDSMVLKGDLTQLQQIIMNLLNNARDALEGMDKPEIHISLSRFKADGAFADAHPDFDSVSRFALLSIQDNGLGIPADVRQHIFEPFYTTKAVGKGTGLGLSMVFGSVQSHLGIIEVDSEVNSGTTFHIYLPLEQEAKTVFDLNAPQETVYGKGETILVADDQRSVLDIASEILARLGYKVLTASDGAQAVEQFKLHREDIALLMFDVVMPSVTSRAIRVILYRPV